MKLKTITLLTLGSLAYLFMIRTISTFLPALFMSPLLGKSVQALSLLAHLIFLAFYFMFLVEFVGKDQKKLHFATLLSIAIATVFSFFYVRGLFLIIPGLSSPLYNASPTLYHIFQSPMLSANLPVFSWLNTLIFLIFLLSFSGEVKGIEKTPLKTATRHAITGMSVMLAIQTILVIIQVFTGGMGWMLPFGFWISALLFPVFMAVFILQFNFFLNLYRILPEE